MNSKQTESKIWKQIVQVNEEEHTRPSLADLLVIDRKDTENEEHLKERTEMHCNEDTEQYSGNQEEGNETHYYQGVRKMVHTAAEEYIAVLLRLHADIAMKEEKKVVDERIPEVPDTPQTGYNKSIYLYVLALLFGIGMLAKCLNVKNRYRKKQDEE